MKNSKLKNHRRWLVLVFTMSTFIIIVSGCGTVNKASQKETATQDTASAGNKGESFTSTSAVTDSTSAKDRSSAVEDTKKTARNKSGGTTEETTGMKESANSTESGTSKPNESNNAKDQTNGSQAVALTHWTSTAATIGESAPKLSGYVIYGRVTNESGQPLTQGVVGIEQGKVHNNNFKYGGVIYPDGTYAIQVSAPGEYGVHLYVDGYIYQPGQVTIDASKKAEFNSVLVKQPEGYNAPSISNPKMNMQDEKIKITLDANDNKEDLSPQVLAINITTGKTFRLLPPIKPIPEIPGKRFAVYPNGTYAISVALKNGGKGRWIFVSANHRCAISDMIRLSVG